MDPYLRKYYRISTHPNGGASHWICFDEKFTSKEAAAKFAAKHAGFPRRWRQWHKLKPDYWILSSKTDLKYSISRLSANDLVD